MDREEAITKLHWLKAELIKGTDLNEPIDMAIEALSADVVQGEWIGYNADKEDWLRTDGTPIFLVCDKCHGTVINNGSAHWNFCPNCGARMTPYKGGDTANYTTKKPNDEVEQKNDIVAKPTDIISRADAIKAIESRQTEQWIDADVDYNNGLESAVAEIKALPSADRPSGEWKYDGARIASDEESRLCWKCSECGHEGNPDANYCGFCGAKMGGKER